MDSSGEYTVEYKFTADVSDLKKGVQEVETMVDEAVQSSNQMGNALSNAFYDMEGSFELMSGKVQAFLVSISALEGVWVKQSLDSFSQYEDAVYGMATTVSNVGGTIEQAMEGIQASTANGLLSQTDAARAINNLTSYGYSVQEATRLVQELTNVSMAHRNESMSVSEQVERLTEGIKRGSSQMLKANGLMTTGSSAQAIYAAAIGKTASELTEAEKRQAMYNSVVQAGEQDSAVATAYQESYSASVQRMNNALNDLKVAFGEAFAPVATVIANIATWVAQNKEVVAVLGTFIGVLVGAGGVAIALIKVTRLVQAAIVWFNGLAVSTKGVVLGLATVAATMVAINISSAKTAKALGEVSHNTSQTSEEMDNLAVSAGGVGGAVRNLTKDLEALTKQYKDDLKQIEIRHQDTINKLTKQIQEANVDYRRAIEERNAEFAVQQAKEEKTHQEKVDDIMTQIAFLQRYNNDYNKQKLTNLQLALQRENALYQKQTEATKAELELQNENDRIAYETKRQQLQAELDEELAFMEKHRADLQEVRGWILADEIDSLKERYEAQKASYLEQAGGASTGGYDVGKSYVQGVDSAIKDYTPEVLNTASDLGSIAGDLMSGNFAGAFGKALSWIIQAVESVINWFNSLPQEIDNYFTGLTQRIQIAGDVIKKFINPGFATGGFTGRGNPNEVAGVVHKGEYVLPQSMVDQSTGTPKAMGNTYITVNLSGTFATSQAERRKVADQIVQAINQNNKSRLEAAWQ